MANATRLLGALVLATGCTATSPAADADPGLETGVCVEGMCLNGLECFSGVCVNADTDGGDGTRADEPGETPSSSDSAPTAPGGPTSSPFPTSGPAATQSGTESGTTDDAELDECGLPVHQPCDDDGDAFVALGLNCPGEPQYEMSMRGASGAATVRSSFGRGGNWSPTEGEQYAVIGTGFVADLGMEAPDGEGNNPTNCNDDIGGQHDLGMELPAPLDPASSGGDCIANPDFVGTGDCSGSLEAPFMAGATAHDYSELRLAGTAPVGSRTASFDFAFFSTEYPDFVGSAFNDMFVAWIESENWTGNVALDASGNVITASSSIIDVQDDDGDDPNFAGTCMRGHGGSNWRRTTAPLADGEEFTLVFAIFDMMDGRLDSYVFIDNVSFGCEALAGPETVLVP